MEKMLKDLSIFGSALIDENLGVFTADESFYGFLGINTDLPFHRCVLEEDLPKLINAMKEADGCNISRTAIRIICDKKQMEWMFVKVEKAENTKDGKKAYRISMLKAEQMAQKIDLVENTITTYSHLMGFSESYFFEYSIKEDYFRIFAIPDGCCTIDLVKGTLDECAKKLFVKGKSKSVNTKQNQAFCDALRTGETHINNEIQLSLTGDNDDLQSYIAKGKTIVDDLGRKKVLGTISLSRAGQAAADVELISEMRDPGTDLLNKRAITDYVRRLIESKPDYNVTIAVIDVDDFKTINDTYGHQFGDEVLSKVANIIKNAVGRKGMCGRIGGDEMFIVIEGLEGNEPIRSVLRTIKSNIGWLYHNDERNINKITCSIGSATYPADADNYQELFNLADKMLYLAKEKGKNRYIIYHDDLHYSYAYGEGETTEKEKKAIFKYRKNEVLRIFVREYKDASPERRKQLYEMISITFGIDTITYYDLNGMKKELLYGEVQDKEASDKDDGSFLVAENYIETFRASGVSAVDNVFLLQQSFPVVYENLRALGLSQAVFYHINEFHYPGETVMFGRFEQERKWAENDVNSLALLGDMIAYDKVITP